MRLVKDKMRVTKVIGLFDEVMERADQGPQIDISNTEALVVEAFAPSMQKGQKAE